MRNKKLCSFRLSWILKYFRIADIDGSNTLTKRECRKLLTNSLNVEVPENIFEQLFQVKNSFSTNFLFIYYF